MKFIRFNSAYGSKNMRISYEDIYSYCPNDKEYANSDREKDDRKQLGKIAYQIVLNYSRGEIYGKFAITFWNEDQRDSALEWLDKLDHEEMYSLEEFTEEAKRIIVGGKEKIERESGLPDDFPEINSLDS